MSYDYNALVTAISTAREQQDFQSSVDSFGELSSHCPMTPLLWMQYASDSGTLMMDLLDDKDAAAQQAIEMKLQTLEIGIEEFPGCAIFRLQYIVVLLQKETANHDTIVQAFENALEHVGSGSHQNEGQVVVQIYSLFCDYLVKCKDYDGVIQVFRRRAATPVAKGANDALSSEFQHYCKLHGINVTAEHLLELEQGRRHVSQLYQSFVTYEDEIDSQMDVDNILASNGIDLEDIPWDALLSNNSCSYWNGLGGHDTALAFIKYAGACAHYQSPRLDGVVETPSNVDATIQSLALAIYERGVAECPTVEVIWTSYLKYLSYCVANGKPVAARLQAASIRAMRNCPYSLALVQQRCKILFILAECGQVVLEPDDLMATVQTALDTKFLPEPIQHLDLYLTAIRTVKRRLLLVLHESVQKKEEATKWDDGTETIFIVNSLSETSEQEVQDICEDLREMYEAADGFLRKTHSSWSEGRMVLWKDRSMTERLVIRPIFASLDADSARDASSDATAEDLRCFEKLLKVHQPTHPDLYTAFIEAILAQPVLQPAQVQVRLQRARGLYHKAVNNFASKPPKVVSTMSRDIETAKRELCHNFIEFETMFGSDKSLGLASRLIQKKLLTSQAIALPAPVNGTGDENIVEEGNKRKSDDVDASMPTTKKVKLANGETPAPLELQEKTTGWKKKPEVPKVRVGKLDYPAHPYTVRVKNLTEDVEDMDLVDIFRVKCGAIVHAKIVREKCHHQKGKSKGWGLVQFEERDAVEKALELNGVIGIKERVVKIDRSHMPATGLVPPGMHRVKPKGEGTSTKQNEKRKEQRQHGETGMETSISMDEPSAVERSADETPAKDETMDEVGADKSTTVKSSASILAFQPRGVARKGGRKAPKMKISTLPNKMES